MKSLRYALLAVLLALLGAGLVRWHRAVPVSPAGELRFVHAQRALRLDPRRSGEPSNVAHRVVRALWEPLLEIDDAGEPRLAAAASLEVADDRRSVVVRLRPELRWSDGEPVRAADFVRAADWFLRSGNTSAVSQLLRQQPDRPGKPPAIATVRALDDVTMRVEFPCPAPGLRFALAEAAWIPLHRESLALLEDDGYRANPLALVTNGAFTLAAAGPDQWRLRRNPHFRSAATVQLESVLLMRTEGPSLFATLLAAGRADLSQARPYLPEEYPELRAPLWRTEKTNALSVLHFNTSRAPLSDVRVRRALSLALDRTTLARISSAGGGTPAFSCSPRTNEEPAGRTVREDLAEARLLLAEAGFPGGRGMPVLRLPLVQSLIASTMAHFCADQWRERLGVRVYVMALPSAEIRRRVERGEFDVMHFLWTLSGGESSLAAFAPLPSVPPAFALKLTAPREEKLTAARELTGAARRAAMFELERELLADVPCTPIVFYRRCTAVGEHVTGWQNDHSGAHAFAELGLRSPGRASP